MKPGRRSLGAVDGFAAVPELDELYDEATLAALDRYRPPTRAGSEAAPARARGVGSGGRLAGAVLTATAFALRDLLEGEDDDAAVEELRPEAGDPGGRWVTFLHVPGAPQASRIVIRPWLAPSIT